MERKIPTIEENLRNMKRCPRFEKCSVPRCPLDFWMKSRMRLPDEERCPLIAKHRTKYVKWYMSKKMRATKKFIYEKNRK